jgi:hypothetical protein
MQKPIVAIPTIPGDVGAIARGKLDKDFRRIANLIVEKVFSRNGPFEDEEGNRYALQAVPGRRGPVSLTLVDRLAFWVALQALHLVGMHDVLYADR